MNKSSLIITVSCALLVLLISVSSVTQAKKQPGARRRAQQQANAEANLEPLCGAPFTKLSSMDEFRNLVMQPAVPIMMFLGSTKTTKQELRDNVTEAAKSLEKHLVSYYFDLATPAGVEFIQSIGIPQTDDTPRVLLWNPEFIKQGNDGYAKHPAQYTGKTSVFGIVRWMTAMISRKHLDYIEDVQDLMTFKNKYKQHSLPKVILVTGSNFTSPIFTSVGHQYRYLAHFGVMKSVSRKAYDDAMDIFEKEEKELRKVKDLDIGSEQQQQDDDDSSKKKPILEHNFAIHDENEQTAENTGYQNEEKKNAAHTELLHVLGIQHVPAIITASADLGDVEVHKAHNMTMTELQEIISTHALPQDQFASLFPHLLEFDYNLEQENAKIAREQRKNAKKSGGNNNADADSSSGSDNNDISNFKPIWVKHHDDWKKNCPHKKSGTLCVAVFSEDIQGNILKYEAKVEELAKGMKKIQSKNRVGYTSVKLMLFENNEETLKLAKVWNAADGVFPAVVFVNPNKGTFYNHIGSFTGASMADFALGRMKTLRAKTFSKEKVLKDHFGGELTSEEQKKQQKNKKPAPPPKKPKKKTEREELEDSINAEDL